MRATLIAVIAVVTALAGCKPSVMNENKFWSIVEASKGIGADEAHADRLERNLRALSADQIEAFDKIYWEIHKNAGTSPVWAAGMLLNGGHGTDDGFEYFRNWLIAQGRATYEKALSHPDSLAKVHVQMNAHGPEAEWEAYGYAATKAYKDKTGKFLREEHKQQNLTYRILNKEPNFDWREYTDEVLAERLPALWQKYGQHKRASDEAEKKRLGEKQQEEPKTVYINGLSVLTVGSQIEHRKFGIGTIKFIDTAGLHPYSVIAFGNVEKSMVIEPGSGLWKLPK